MKATTMHLPQPSQLAIRAREWGPYALAALLLPGGLIVALVLWASQHFHKGDVK